MTDEPKSPAGKKAAAGPDAPVFLNVKSRIIHQLEQSPGGLPSMLAGLDEWELLVDLLKDRDLTRMPKRINTYCDGLVLACLVADGKTLEAKLPRKKLRELALTNVKHSGRAAAMILAHVFDDLDFFRANLRRKEYYVLLNCLEGIKVCLSRTGAAAADIEGICLVFRLPTWHQPHHDLAARIIEECVGRDAGLAAPLAGRLLPMIRSGSEQERGIALKLYPLVSNDPVRVTAQQAAEKLYRRFEFYRDLYPGFEARVLKVKCRKRIEE